MLFPQSAHLAQHDLINDEVQCSLCHSFTAVEPSLDPNLIPISFNSYSYVLPSTTQQVTQQRINVSDTIRAPPKFILS